MKPSSLRSWPIGLAFVLGLAALVAMGRSFVGSSVLALAVTVVMGLAYLVASWEVRQLAAHSKALSRALGQVPEGLQALDEWLSNVPAPWRNDASQHGIRVSRRYHGEFSL